MIEMRWSGRTLQYRQRNFCADASGALCGQTDFGPWVDVSEYETCWSEIEQRDDAEKAADQLAASILGEEIDWADHQDAWDRALEQASTRNE